MSRSPIVRGSLVSIRVFDEGDVEFLARTANDLEVQQLAHPSPGYPVGEAELRRRIAEGYRAPMSAVRQGFEFVLAHADDGALSAIGVAGLYRIDERNGNAEVGVSISSGTDRGRGVGKEAHLLMISYAFEVLSLHRVYGHAKRRNARACRLAESIGMKHEGTMREHRRRAAAFDDLEIFGVLSAEWPHRLPSAG